MRASLLPLLLASALSFGCEPSSQHTPGPGALVDPVRPSDQATPRDDWRPPPLPPPIEPRPTSIADAPIADIEIAELRVGPAFAFTRSTAQPQQIAAAGDGRALCLGEVFADEDRFLVSERAHCGHIEPWELRSTQGGDPLAVVDEFLQYSAPLDAITVKRKGDRRVSFVTLADGVSFDVDGDTGADSHLLVEDHGAVVTVGYTGEGPGRRLGIGITEGLTRARPALDIRPAVVPSRPVAFDAERGVYTFRSRGCARAALRGDGQEGVCEVRLPAEYGDGSGGVLRGNWFVPERGRAPSVALNVASGQSINPAEGLCAEPTLTMPHELDDTAVVFACPVEDPPHKLASDHFVWVPPDRRVRLPTGTRHAQPAFGSFAGYLFQMQGPGMDGSRGLLDLEKLVLWKSDGYELLGPRTLADATVSRRRGPATVEFSRIEDDRALRSLGSVQCDGELRLLYDDDDVVSVGCGGTREQTTQCGTQPRLDHTVTWDLRTSTRIDTPLRLVAATRSSLLFSHASHLGTRDEPCPGSALSSMPR